MYYKQLNFDTPISAFTINTLFLILENVTLEYDNKAKK